jgi:hypothetical protein
MITVYGTSFNPHSLEAHHTRRSLHILTQYQPKFADLNQELIKAHLVPELVDQSVIAESLSRKEIAEILGLLIVNDTVSLPQIYLET